MTSKIRSSGIHAFATVFAVALGLLSGCGGGGGGTTTTNAPSENTFTNLTTFWAFDSATGSSSPAVNAPGLEADMYSTSIVPGRFGNALKLDPALSSYAVINILIPRADSWRYLVYSGNKVSVAMWINPDVLTPNATYHLFGNGYWGVKSFRLLLVDGKVTFDLFNPKNGNNDPIISSQTAVSQGAWTHIAVTYDGSTATVYLNGNVDASNSISHPIADEYNNIYIGGVGDGSASLTFPGSIDEVLLTSSSLSASKVAQYFSGYRPLP